MQDYHSWISILISIILILLNTIVFSFNSSLKYINYEEDIEKKEFKSLNEIKNIMYTILILSIYINNELIIKNIKYPNKILVYFIYLLLYLIFAVSLPRYISKKFFEKFLSLFNPLLRILLFIFMPINYLINIISDIILKIFSIDSKIQIENVTEEEIINMIQEGHEQGVLKIKEASMINNILALTEKKASDIMTNRKNIVCLDSKTSLGDTVEFMLNEGINSRYPIYDENIDNIIGIINMKDALIFLRKSYNKNKAISDIKGLIRKVEFVLETKNLFELFQEMQANRLHLVIVIDEYSQTQGLVCLEDILEAIVGDILDEYDLEETDIIKKDENTYIVKGSCSLLEFSEILNIDIDKEDLEDFDTLNGFIINKLDRLPKDNEKFEIIYKNIKFTSLEVKNKFIESMKVSLIY